jgi:integrase/recombinase XerD
LGVKNVGDVNSKVLHSYVLFLEEEGRKPATISRSIASMKAFYHYLESEQRLAADPSEELKAPHIDKKMPTVLSDAEIRLLLDQPKGNSPKDLRDKAMLELVCATGMRASEIVSLKMSDVDLEKRRVTCEDSHKKREIVFSEETHDAIERYINEGRDKLISNADNELLFTNCSGDAMSRQGFWKLMKGYGRKAGIEQEITPHMLRHSCAAHMISSGTDLKDVQRVMGHSDVSTTQIYTRLF